MFRNLEEPMGLIRNTWVHSIHKFGFQNVAHWSEREIICKSTFGELC